MTRVAVLIDGGFFLKRFRTVYPGQNSHDAEVVTKCLHLLIGNHLRHLNRQAGAQNEWSLLYRSFFYDAAPYAQQGQYPVSRKPINYARSPEAVFRAALFDRLRRAPNMAVRLGEVRKAPDRSWVLNADVQADLLAGRRTLTSLTDADFRPALSQKGVDMRLGVDVATLTLKGLVDTVVLVTGDADFVPAAKLARREGVRVILDPLWMKISGGLFEHIDGLYSGVRRPGTPQSGDEVAG